MLTSAHFVEGEINLQRFLIANRPATFRVRTSGNNVVGKLHLDAAVISA